MIRAIRQDRSPRQDPKGGRPLAAQGYKPMSRQDANAAFALTSFLYGGNADYIDELYARYEDDPQAVHRRGQWVFSSLKDSEWDVVQNARGASWQRSDWPPLPRGDLV